MESVESIKKLVLTAVFTALIVIGTYFAIPIGPVPIVLANMFAIAAGLILGPVYGGASVLVYLLLGVIGIPVFSGGGAGIAHLTGPTGGYLLGYLLGAVVAGLIALPAKKNPSLGFLYFVAAGIGILTIYVPGLLVLKNSLGKTWNETLAIGFYPFLIGEVVKIGAAGAAGLFIKVGKAKQ